MKDLLGLALIVVVVASPLAADSESGHGGEAVPPWPSRAESSGFEATSGYEETLDYIRRLSAEMPEMTLTSFGRSARGLALPLVVVSGDKAFTPREAERSGKAIVLIQNGIHAGEIDGKDACLMILRDLAAGRHREWLESLILLVVPIYNVDGHERVSPYNRPNQNGPREGMGFRTTADGHDLNRDHLKLVTPEARSMIRLFNDWRPHLHVDDHVTDGVDHDWVLTYAWVEGPQAAPALQRWLDSHMPAVSQATEKAGHRVGPYVRLIDRDDPAKGFDSWVGQPRFATGYYPLRNRPSILVENHAYKEYRNRVLANRDFLVALLAEIARDPKSLIAAVRGSERRTVALGRPDAPPSDVVLRYQREEPLETVSFPVYDWSTEPSEVMGVPLVHYRRGEVREIRVPWAHRAEPEVTVPRPRGYLVLPGWPVIERRLEDHGLRVRRLTEAVTLDVETMRISDPTQNERSHPSYQGLTLIEVQTRRSTERRVLPEGTLWIPADQPDFEVAVQLFEPEAPDSLVRWGLLSSVLERKEYIEPANLERLARAMLEDERTAALWAEALKDEAFAGDPWARYLWWYRRTDYWDETVGLMPVMRLMSPPTFETSAWSGPVTGF